MRMQIDFYSKNEVFILINFTDRYPYPESEVSELFLFSCYTLRQFSNLGQHLVAYALAGLLVSEYQVIELFKDNPKLSSGRSQLSSIQAYVLRMHGIKGGSKDEAVWTTLENSLRYTNQDTLMQILDDQYLLKLPRLVDYRDERKKSFITSLPPFRVEIKGFGLLGWQINYYAFHSVVALIRYLAQKHTDNQDYLNHLVNVTMHCGYAHIYNRIPYDQVELAKAILKDVGLT